MGIWPAVLHLERKQLWTSLIVSEGRSQRVVVEIGFLYDVVAPLSMHGVIGCGHFIATVAA